MNKPLTIEIFADFVCPWCYLATAVVEKVREQTPLDVRWLPYPLHPGTPPEGMLLSDMLPGMDLAAAHRRLYALMDDLGLEHGHRNMTYNSRLAQELALWADTVPNGEKLQPQIYRAYFVHDRNLADEDVLLDLAGKAGLDVADARDVLRERRFSKAVDEAWSRARQLRISGVPTFITGGYQLTGFHPPADLLRFVEHVSGTQAPE